MITEKIRTELEKELQEKCEKANIPGMALIATHKGKRVFEKYYGYRDVEKQLPVNEDTVFGAASLTKSFATLAIMQLEDAGKLTVEDPVKKWIPEFQLTGGASPDDVTIHHLMTHTAGFPALSAVHQARAESIARDPDGEYLFEKIPALNGDKVTTVMDMIEVITQSNDPVLGQPGEMFNYSNESYAILQEIIERASGENFLEYMDQHVFSPLEMTRSTFVTDDLAEVENVTELYAYSKDKERTVFHSPAWWDVGEIYTNGSLKTSAADLIKYLDVYRQKGTVDGLEIITETSVDKMTYPHIVTPNEIQYGYGFTVGEELGVNVFGHGGSIKGVSSFMMVAPEEELTICVLINIAEADAGEMALTAMKHLLDLHDEQRNEVPTYEMSKEQLAKYVGKYESAEGQKVRVSVDRGELIMHMGLNDIQLTPCERHKFLTPDGKKVAFNEREGKIVGIFRGLRYIGKVS